MGQISETVVTRTCDACGKSLRLVQGKIDDLMMDRAAGWLVLTKEHHLGKGQLLPMAKLACSDECAIVILNAKQLDLPKPPAYNVEVDWTGEN